MLAMLTSRGAALGLAIVMAACATAQSSPVSSTPVATQPSARTTPAPTSSPSRMPSAAPESPPALLPSWTELGAVEVGRFGSVDGVVAFDRGLVAWGTYAEADALPVVVTWYSRDGRSWSMSEHSTTVSPCPGWSPRPNLDAVYDAATDGEQVVLLASILDAAERPTCDAQQLVALRTADGTAWTRSEPFGSGWVESAWASGDRFEARAHDGTIWTSVDGLGWNPVVQDVYSGEVVFDVGGATADGARVAVKGAAEDGQSILVSHGVEPWTEVYRLPADVWAEIVPPVDAANPWIAAGNVYGVDSEAPAVLYLTNNLVDWSAAAFPRTGVASVVAMSEGWVAIGFNLIATQIIGCLDACPDMEAAWYRSENGRDWTELPSPDGAAAASLAVAPSDDQALDLIAIVGQADGLQPVWGLDLP